MPTKLAHSLGQACETASTELETACEDVLQSQSLICDAVQRLSSAFDGVADEVEEKLGHERGRALRDEGIRALQFEDIARQRLEVVHRRVATVGIYLARLAEAVSLSGVESEAAERVFALLIQDLEAAHAEITQFRGDQALQKDLSEGEIDLF